MSQTKRLQRPLHAAPYAAVVAALAAGFGGGVAHSAVVDVKPYAEYDWESDHNPFSAPDASSGAILVTRPNVDDKVSTLVAGLNIKHDAGGGSTYVTGEGRKVGYSTFHAFNHTEYTGALGHKRSFQSGSAFGIEFGASRQFTPFDILAADTPVAYQKRRYGRLTGTLRLATRNVLDASFERAYLRLPISGAPDFNSVQNNLQLGYGRLVGTSVTLGVRATGLTGSQYDNAVVVPFRQVTPELFLNYSSAGALEITSAIGATKRTQDGTAGTKATVGNISARYALSTKTAVRAGVVRGVTSYYVAGGSQVTTAWSAGVDWRPTDRLSFLLEGSRTHGLYELPGAVGSHTDDLNYGQFTASWKPLDWLTFGAYGRVQKRASTSIDYRFGADTAGISVKIQRP